MFVHVMLLLSGAFFFEINDPSMTCPCFFFFKLISLLLFYNLQGSFLGLM